MPRRQSEIASKIYAAADVFRDKALAQDGSLFSPGTSVWTPATIEDLRNRFVLRPDESKNKDFEEKFRGQLADAPAATVLLAAEMIFVHLLISTQLKGDTKRALIQTVLSYGPKGPSIPEALSAALDGGLCNAGQAFLRYRYALLNYLIEFAKGWKALDADTRHAALTDPWAFKRFVFSVPAPKARTQQYALLHLVHPDTFEAIVSEKHRIRVIQAFLPADRPETADLDQELQQVRSLLTPQYGPSFSFYQDDLKPRWLASEDESSFSDDDFKLFARYANTVNYGGIPEADKKRFQNLRHRVRLILDSTVHDIPEVEAWSKHLSAQNPSGNTPKDYWCAIYPPEADNKSYAIQVALIISRYGVEVCFCLGAGDAQFDDPKDRRTNEAYFAAIRQQLKKVPDGILNSLGLSLDEKWYFRRKWRLPPGGRDFSTLREWRDFAAAAGGEGASISRYFSPAEVIEAGGEIGEKYEEAVRLFLPVFTAIAAPVVSTSTASGTLVSPSTETAYWWLNANPKTWDLEQMPVGERQTYTSHNEKGNKRQKYKYFQEVKPGDIVVSYVTSPQREVVAISRITQGLHLREGVETIEFEKVEQVAEPLPLSTLQANPELANSEPLLGSQGSLFKLTEHEYEVIRSLIDDRNTPPLVATAPYSQQDALSTLFISEGKFDEILTALREKKNIVLLGAPGVGKTFVAKRLAQAFIGAIDPQRIQAIQFHQSYSYEDFIQGFRPTPQGHFELRHGVFHQFCRRAQRHESTNIPHVFIIDEINRGNLSKIFGELMMLLECDKRGKEHAIPLSYSQDADETFYVPGNLYLIGMMNTADRSLAMVDYALRRRFRFITLRPEFVSDGFRKSLMEAGAAPDLINKIVRRMSAVNEVIAADTKNLGPGYEIGHSFFCSAQNGGGLDEQWYKRIIESEIVPLLEEYWFGDPQKVKDQRTALLA